MHVACREDLLSVTQALCNAGCDVQHQNRVKRDSGTSALLYFVMVQGGPKHEPLLFRNKFVLQYVPTKLVLADLCVTHVVTHSHIIF